MVDYLRIEDAAQRQGAVPEGIPAAEYGKWATHQPDMHLIDAEKDQVRARCSLWWTLVPELPGEKLGVIGHFAAKDTLCAERLLTAATEKLKEQKCTLAVGPMDGNTWRSYRFVTWIGPEPPFFLEPGPAAEYPAYFQRSGFDVLAEYTSAVSEQMIPTTSAIEKYRGKMRQAGIRLRPMRNGEFDGELDCIYEISEVAFRANYLYTPLTREQFKAQYQVIQKYVQPELVLLAEKEGKALGYVFAIPDWLEKQRDPKAALPKTVIVKTLAVLPEAGGIGIGGALLAEVQLRAHEIGFTRCIHALMHVSNRSQKLSEKYAREMRRYALFSKRL